MFGNSKDNKKQIENIAGAGNIIGKGTTITGDVDSVGNIRLEAEAKVKGNIRAKAKLSMGQGALVEGNVHCINAEVAGVINGTIEVTELLVLKSTAVINGDIVANKLAVEAGAVFNGLCKMGGTTGANKRPETVTSHNAIALEKQ